MNIYQFLQRGEFRTFLFPSSPLMKIPFFFLQSVGLDRMKRKKRNEEEARRGSSSLCKRVIIVDVVTYAVSSPPVQRDNCDPIH